MSGFMRFLFLAIFCMIALNLSAQTYLQYKSYQINLKRDQQLSEAYDKIPGFIHFMSIAALANMSDKSEIDKSSSSKEIVFDPRRVGVPMSADDFLKRDGN